MLRDVIVDMSRVKYMDSTCLTKLATMRKCQPGEARILPPAKLGESVERHRAFLYVVTSFDEGTAGIPITSKRQ